MTNVHTLIAGRLLGLANSGDPEIVTYVARHAAELAVTNGIAFTRGWAEGLWYGTGNTRTDAHPFGMTPTFKAITAILGNAPDAFTSDEIADAVLMFEVR